ncbi:DUF2730 family protein [Thalassobaculum litoreum]|uniref:DUF2730 family protein n=1 Tax=Thalassobaculum litoreum DSM 18839 TaxID=1123362 RepID=A0A8G2BMZ3_9PROT|nr:DUF2730 family protein [Thalassobaculum litoreum]SDG62720.1 Protein of unknown function [Thalassobaculum litoreum DSM 18839]
MILDLVKELNAWAGLLSVVGMALVAIAMLYLRSVFAPQSALEEERRDRDEITKELTDRVHTLERSVDKLDQLAAVAPTQTDLQKIAVAIESFRGDFKAMAAEVTALDRSVSQIGRKVDMLVENEIQVAQNRKGSS